MDEHKYTICEYPFSHGWDSISSEINEFINRSAPDNGYTVFSIHVATKKTENGTTESSLIVVYRRNRVEYPDPSSSNVLDEMLWLRTRYDENK